jgi:hypothetical protein
VGGEIREEIDTRRRVTPTVIITDMEVNTRGDMASPVETVWVTKMVTVLACPVEYDVQVQ